MSNRRDLDAHIRSLEEISDIMGAMKNLAVLETQKLARLLSAQERAVSTMRAAGTDLLTFYPAAQPRNEKPRCLYLVIGSERGLCGDYNDKVLSALQQRLQGEGDKTPAFLTVGRKITARLTEHRFVTVSIEGPVVAEEIQSVMIRVMDRIQELQAREASGVPLAITVVSHVVETGGVEAQPLRPFEDSPARIPPFPDPPLLNMPPPLVLAELMELFLFSLLHKIFYGALLAENRARVSHLEGSIQRLEKEASELGRRRNVLRQEEITQEIELLMLNAERLRHR
ncbi:MAG TPA: FoF1 ATP synthase subunit gamma [Nitrospira sp.]